MSSVFLGLVLVLGGHLFLVGLINSTKSRTHLIEKHLGATLDSRRGGWLTIFTGLKRFVAGDQLNPWGTDELVAKALRRSGDCRSLMQFRRSQLISMLGSQVCILLWALLRRLSQQSVSALFVITAFVFVIPVSGWVMYSLLQNKTKKRQQIIDQQLASSLELLAFSVAAGEPIILAIERVANLCSGVLAEILGEIPQRLIHGATIASALNQATEMSSSASFDRSIRAIQIALDRGTPIAGVLRAQAAQARSVNQQQLLQLAGKKEAAMMVPVVFLILPMIVFIALYPGLSALQLA